MPISPAKFVPYEMKTTIIKIFTYENKIPTGVLINPYFDGEVHFSGVIQMLLLMDELQDGLSFPQKSMTPRSFTERRAARAEAGSAAEPENASGYQPLASLKISIMFRQNASWQGSVAWLEESMQTEFRSALELVFLLDNVLDGKKT
ncbi:MAG: hypothetical protein LBT12_00395 [Oscillospiraceae bacterium]|jgi:hypothetical protein|nr:hypothetical protein [Oscillospiraceae bacterium]